jgi:hypothetical protein
MGPLAVITAIAFGSAVAIAFGLNGVLVIMWVLRGESEQMASEIHHLWIYCVLFIVLSLVAGSAMYSLMKRLPWRIKAQWAMWSSLVLTGVLVWLQV